MGLCKRIHCCCLSIKALFVEVGSRYDTSEEAFNSQWWYRKWGGERKYCYLQRCTWFMQRAAWHVNLISPSRFSLLSPSHTHTQWHSPPSSTRPVKWHLGQWVSWAMQPPLTTFKTTRSGPCTTNCKVMALCNVPSSIVAFDTFSSLQSTFRQAVHIQHSRMWFAVQPYQWLQLGSCIYQGGHFYDFSLDQHQWCISDPQLFLNCT